MKTSPQTSPTFPRRVAVAVLLAFCASLLAHAPAGSAQTETTSEQPGVAELKRGDYERAVQILGARLAKNAADAEAARLLLRAYVETGRYAEAEAAARKFLSKTPEAGGVRHMLGEALAATGRYPEAVKEFEDAAKSEGRRAERLESDLRRAEVLEATGQESRAREIYSSLVGYYNESGPDDAGELTSVGRAFARLDRPKDASELFMAAIGEDAAHVEAQLGGGFLFTEKYNYAEAAEFFADALRANPNSARAHLGVALNKRLEGGAEMTAALERALAINPNMVEARALKAAVALEAAEYAEAAAEIEKALKVNPRSADALALRAALAYLEDRDYQPEVAAALAVNPRGGALYDTLAHYATITRRTAQAADFARRAVELSPRLWRAHLSLGMALLRLGKMEDGRAAVEKAFAGDPFNVWAKNTLDLLDAMKDFRETRRGQFVVKASAEESEVLGPYAADLLEEAAAKLTAKYRFTPQGPVIVELFPNHEDFAVRALGLPGLGALGVCFGPVIAQDSPSARAVGEFNWGSTLWHEYAHVITLQMTDYRIPRWFSEGISVYEERRARPGWGDDWNAAVLRAHADGRWFKIADLDAGFMRPKRADDVSLAYFQASQVVEFVAERHGFDAVLKMLALYKDKARTPDVLRQALKLTEDEFDRAFAEYVEGKARPLAAALGAMGMMGEEIARLPKEEVLKRLGAQETFALHMRAGSLFREEGDAASAARHYKRGAELFPYYTGPGNAYEALADIFEKLGDAAPPARHYKRGAELFPYYTGPGNAYEALADIFEKLGDTEGAALALERIVKLDENNLDALKRLAALRLKQNDPERALDALRLGFYVSPFEHAAHARAGELLFARREHEAALREFQASLALKPPNAAEANYNVARSYHALGRRDEARRSVLRALEAAPAYEQAQELLLAITGQ